MEIVVIDNLVKERIKEVIQHAERNVISLEAMVNAINNPTKPPKEITKDFRLFIEIDTTVTYTHEYQKGNVLCRHMSVSRALEGKAPSPDSVSMIMTEFGFINGLNECLLYLDEYGEHNQTVVNVIEPLSGDMNELMRTSVLSINDDIRQDIKRIIENATLNPTSLEVMTKLLNSSTPQPAPGGNDPAFTMNFIENGLTVTYTHEYIPGNVLCRHISISKQGTAVFPLKEEVEALMTEFGFINRLNECPIKVQGFEHGAEALNVVEPVSGDMNEFASIISAGISPTPSDSVKED